MKFVLLANFYTTYNYYNKWHKTFHPCPFCHKIPENVYHIVLDYRFTKVTFRRIQKVLLNIIPIPVTDTDINILASNHMESPHGVCS